MSKRAEAATLDVAREDADVIVLTRSSALR